MEGVIPNSLPDRDIEDILALRNIFLTGQRAFWQLAISPKSYAEISATTDPHRRAQLAGWFSKMWVYWREFFDQYDLSDAHAESLARRLVPSQYLAPLPEDADRELVAHAIAYGCDAFCTRDRHTILNKRSKLSNLPLKILSPTEWWRDLEPYGALWA